MCVLGRKTSTSKTSKDPTKITGFLALPQVAVGGAREQLWKHKESKVNRSEKLSNIETTIRVCSPPPLATLHGELKCGLCVFQSD